MAKNGIFHEMAKQTLQAVDEADIVIFVVDGRNGMSAHDKVIADQLRRTNRPVYLAVNKAEGRDSDVAVSDFHSLGPGTFAMFWVVSAVMGVP